MNFDDVCSRLFGFDSYLIFCHARPDGDTIGSALALKETLKRMNKRVDIVCASPIPKKFGIFGDASEILALSDVKEVYTAHVAVDCSTGKMIAEAYSLFLMSKNTFNIDHHVSNEYYADVNLVIDAASCAENMYNVISRSQVPIDKTIADRLLLGISTDTGNFMHANVTAETLAIASDLVKKGGDLHSIAYAMFKSQPRERAELFAKIISGMRFFSDGKIAIINVTRKDVSDFNATQDMTEGFIDYPLSVNGVEVAVSIMENKDNCYKVSLRSKGRVNVNEVASAFGGGGHILASGCLISGFYEDVKDKLIREIGFQL